MRLLSDLLFVVVCLTSLRLTVAADYEATWVIGTAWARPDCNDRMIYTINGQAPGPSIRLPMHSSVKITVVNNLISEETSMHWHGFQHRATDTSPATPYADGTPRITQCGILPGMRYTYEFNTGNQAGTFWYHAHSGMQRTQGLYGTFVVEEPAFPFSYDAELPYLTIGDWHHRQSIELAAAAINNPQINTGFSTSILLNFQGYGDCPPSNLLTEFNGQPNCYNCNNTGSNCAGWYSYNVEAGKTYMLRVAHVGIGQTPMNFTIRGHQLTVVAADLHFVQPQVVDYIPIGTGQRYVVLFTANQAVDNYFMTAKAWNPLFREGHAVLHYAGAAPATIKTIPPLFPNAGPPGIRLKVETLRMHPIHNRVVPPASAVTKRFTLVSEHGKDPHFPSNADAIAAGRLEDHWMLNRVSFRFPETPAIFTSYFGLNYTEPNDLNVHHVALGDVVEVLIQLKFPAFAPLCLPHPFHFHGYDMFILGMGDQEFTEDLRSTLNEIDPPIRDTHQIGGFVPPGTLAQKQATNPPCGWMVFRFVANNPGPWLFHCHIDHHAKMGMMMLWDVAHGTNLPAPPREVDICGSQIKWDHYQRLGENDCTPSSCNGRGECIDGPFGIHQCVNCQQGYDGPECEHDIEECAVAGPTACSGHGECVDGVGFYSCVCDPGHVGDRCEIEPNDCPKTNACNSRGFCTDLVGAYECNCLPGFTGHDCQHQADKDKDKY